MAQMSFHFGKQALHKETRLSTRKFPRPIFTFLPNPFVNTLPSSGADKKQHSHQNLQNSSVTGSSWSSLAKMNYETLPDRKTKQPSIIRSPSPTTTKSANLSKVSDNPLGYRFGLTSDVPELKIRGLAKRTALASPKPSTSNQPGSSQTSSARNMTADNIVADPLLLSVLAAANAARDQCLSILDLLASIENSTQATLLGQDLQSQKKVLYSHLAKVRGLNRKAVLGVRKTKSETADKRQEVDRLHLGLQNLKYEQSHLRRQIGLCENFEYVYCFPSDAINPADCVTSTAILINLSLSFQSTSF
jgi:hypothetical protein